MRVPADYFGVNFQLVELVERPVRERQLDAIAGAGIERMRVNFSWAVLEPEPAASGSGYRFERYDAVLGAAARRGITVEPTIVQSPGWATSETGLAGELECGHASSRRPAALAPYVELVRAVARRYGRGGSFWRGQPEARTRPVTSYEIWNEANLNGGWCPRPEPERYAEMFVAAAAAIRGVDPRAAVLVGGLGFARAGTANNIDPAEFLRRATAAQPDLARAASAVAVIVDSRTGADAQARRVSDFRDILRAGGIPDATPVVVAEQGWTTSGTNGRAPVTEAERAAGYEALTRTLSRTNCNLGAVLAHTWVSDESDPDDVEDWFGIANPFSAALYPSARRYARGVALIRGRLEAEPPRRTITACRGMRKPDQDGDAIRDERDYHPLDRGRVTKGGRLTTTECSVRMIFLRERMRDASGAERRRLARAYDRLRKRCVGDCRHQRLRRLERRALSTDSPAKERKRRVKHRRLVGRCR